MELLSKNTRIWLRGLGAAFISTFSSSASGYISMPSVFNFSHDGMVNMLKLSLIPAAVAVLAYLKQSPLPTPENGQPAK